MKNLFSACKIIFLMLLVNPAFAQVSLEQADDLRYRLLGPIRGGRVSTVVGVPSQPFTFYMGTTGGGVWKTTDAGTTWNNVSDGFIKVGSIGAVTVAPSDPNVIYVGTGSPDPRGNVSPGDGLYKSTNGGESWKKIGLEDAGQVGKIIVHPDDHNIVYAAVLGNIFGPSTTRGVYRTNDGGENWQRVLYVNDITGAVDLAIDPNNPRTLFAGMWTAQRKPWTLIDGSEDSGVWRSIDGGYNWTRLEGGLPKGILGRVGVAVSPADSRRVWVIQEAAEEKDGGLYRSDDGGRTFNKINRNHALRQRAWYYNRIIAHPTDENTCFIMNVNILKSVDGGKSFARVNIPHGDNHALWINPNNSDIMVEGNDGGACVTLNGGDTWSTLYNQPTAELYRVTVDNDFPYRVYAAQQDNTTISIPSRFSETLDPFQEMYAVGGGESGHIAVDPRNPNLIYAGNYIGQITRLDRDKRHAKDVVAYPQMHDGQAPRDIKYRFQWNAPIMVSKHDPDVVYHCSQYVHKTKDGGKSWETISPDLTTDNDDYHDIPGGPVQHDHTGVELYTTIFALTESNINADILWAGSDDGLIHLTKDGGQNWTNITPKQMPAGGTVNKIALSPHVEGKAYVSVYRYRENDFRPYIFVTEDFGKKWKLLTNGRNGIPDDHFIRVVIEDPKRKGLLYAGTEFGMYISFNDGKNWQTFQQNLPYTPITDLVRKNNDLVVATQGRSIWILDDLTPLYELTENIAAKKVHLYTPQVAYRNQFRNHRGSAAPGASPNGALIHFHLAQKTDSLIKIKILDANDQVRKVYSTRPEENEQGLYPHKGLNRIEWNMKYEGPDVIKAAQFSLANTGGIKAPTAIHKVQLEYGQTKEIKELEIAMHPKWTQKPDDLIAQYELSNKAAKLLTECHDVIREVRSIKNQIHNLMTNAREHNINGNFEAPSKQILIKLDSIENLLIQTKSESGQDPINYPSMLDDQIA
ncbi:MAG: glycosyl hydrolase, partial [Bacteroidota bacterium]